MRAGWIHEERYVPQVRALLFDDSSAPHIRRTSPLTFRVRFRTATVASPPSPLASTCLSQTTRTTVEPEITETRSSCNITRAQTLQFEATPAKASFGVRSRLSRGLSFFPRARVLSAAPQSCLARL